MVFGRAAAGRGRRGTCALPSPVSNQQEVISTPLYPSHPSPSTLHTLPLLPFTPCRRGRSLATCPRAPAATGSKSRPCGVKRGGVKYGASHDALHTTRFTLHASHHTLLHTHLELPLGEAAVALYPVPCTLPLHTPHLELPLRKAAVARHVVARELRARLRAYVSMSEHE